MLGLTLAAMAGTLGAAAPAAAEGRADAEGAFASCPARAELPEGADPERWRCEVVTATGSLTIGRAHVPLKEPLVITHAEGRIDGEFHQVFGGLKADPVRVPGTPLRMKMRYGGSFDFHSNEERMGELALTFGISSGPLLPRGCAIGSAAEPVQLILQAVGNPEPGQMPDVMAEPFAAPRTSGCGKFGSVLDSTLGLPAPVEQNSLYLDGERAIRSYTELP